MGSNRQQWIDIAKGIGIFLVVFEHTNRGLVSSGVMPKSDLFLLTDYTIYIFHMPLFFLLSGLTIGLHSQKLETFFFRRILLIVYAYLIWSVGQLLLQNFFSDYVNHPASLSDLATIFYAPIGQFWFIYALIICHLVYLGTIEKPALILLAIAISVPVQFAELGIVSVVARNFPYYAAGLLFARHLNEWRSSWVVSAALVACFAIAAVINWVLVGSYSAFSAIPAACLGIAFVLAGSKLITGRLADVLTAMGRLSFPIFLAHVIATAAIRSLLIQLHVPRYAVLYVVFGTIAGIALPMLLHWAAARFSLLPLFGFAPFPIFSKDKSASARHASHRA